MARKCLTFSHIDPKQSMTLASTIAIPTPPPPKKKEKKERKPKPIQNANPLMMGLLIRKPLKSCLLCKLRHLLVPCIYDYDKRKRDGNNSWLPRVDTP